MMSYLLCWYCCLQLALLDCGWSEIGREHLQHLPSAQSISIQLYDRLTLPRRASFLHCAPGIGMGVGHYSTMELSDDVCQIFGPRRGCLRVLDS